VRGSTGLGQRVGSRRRLGRRCRAEGGRDGGALSQADRVTAMLSQTRACNVPTAWEVGGSVWSTAVVATPWLDGSGRLVEYG
jgi:hypothetical protein